MAGSPALSPEDSVATLHQVNSGRARLTGLNARPIPDGIATPFNGGAIIRSSGFMFRLRPDGTLLSVQSMARRNLGPPPSPGQARPTGMGAPTPVSSATFRPNGKISTLHTASLDIRTGPRGQRVITSRRSDHSTLVSTGLHSGYLQRALQLNGRAVTQRIYVSGTNTYSNIYVGTTFHGLRLPQYQPTQVYPASFYEWVYGGWGSPVSYRWNLSQQRWYASYFSFFVPWPSYANGSLWLTDYFLAQTLEDGSAMQQADAGSPQPDAADATDPASADAASEAVPQPDADGVFSATQTTPITPELKQTIAAQVDDQLILDDASAARPIANANQDGPASDLSDALEPGRLLVVDTLLSANVDRATIVSAAGGAARYDSSIRSCSLSPGDVLRVFQPPAELPSRSYASTTPLTGTTTTTAVLPGIIAGPPDRPAPLAIGLRPAVLEVAASLRGDCPSGIRVDISPMDLEEMENNFRARIDDGLHVLSNRQGKNGLPSAPPSTTANALNTPSAQPAEPLPNVAAMLQALPGQASQAETEFTQTMFEAQDASASH
jgi:hypothetical protein